MIKKILIFIILFNNLSFSKKVTIKMATLAPEGTPWHALLAEMGQRWKTETDGNVRLRIYPGGVVGDERDMIRKMRIGQIHGAAISAEGLTEINPQYSYSFLPLFFQNFDDIDFVRSEINDELIAGSLKGGFKVLAMVDIGWVYWFTKNEVLTPDNLKQQKIWTWAGDYKTAKMYSDLGFNAIPISVPDVHASLQTGLINAYPFPPIFVLANQYFAFSDYMLNMKWGILTAAIVLDLKTWNRLSQEYQDIIISISNEISSEYQDTHRKDANSAINAMKKYGLKVNDLNIENRAEWEKLVESIYPTLRGTLIDEDIFDKVIKLKKDLPSNKMINQ